MQTDHNTTECTTCKTLIFLLLFHLMLDFSTNIVAMFSKLGAFGSFEVASLGLFKVYNVPDRGEILLTDYVSFTQIGTETD